MKAANENVLRVLARVMAPARAGNVEAVAIVAVSPSGDPEPSFGGEAELMPSTYLGLDMLKQQILFHVMGSVEQKQTTSIVRPAS
jgi:hypothetical protein